MADQVLHRITILLLGATLCVASSLAAVAQDSPEEDGYTVVQSIEPPTSEVAESYRSAVVRRRVETDVTYVSELSGKLISGRARAAPPVFSRNNTDQIDLNGFGVVLALLIVMGGLFIWLKFGGAGVLLSRPPQEPAPRNNAPDAWKIASSEIDKDASGLLRQIAAMQDRRAAMVLLLRYCLLAGAQTTGARFARSDTERQAFGRLPDGWAYHDGLETILQQAELAHYGGRPVGDNVFAAALDTGRTILKVGPAHG